MNQRKKQKATKDFKTAFVRLIVFPYEQASLEKPVVVYFFSDATSLLLIQRCYYNRLHI